VVAREAGVVEGGPLFDRIGEVLGGVGIGDLADLVGEVAEGGALPRR